MRRHKKVNFVNLFYRVYKIGMEKLQLQAIGAELVALRDRDQAMRRSPDWDAAIDVQNTARLKEIITEIDGWPLVSKVGTDANVAAWLLAQHADLEPDFQKQCLQLMKAAPEGEVRLQDIAYLEDRVRVNFGQPQLYGTQFISSGEQFEVRPIEDEANLDARRTSMLLEPFADNMARVKALAQEST
jgi:hypothetical protein